MNKNNVLVDAFKWLFIGLFVCFLTAYFSSTSEDVVLTVYGSGKYLVFCILEIVIAVTFNVAIRKLSPILAKAFYLVYAGLTGLTLSGIFLIYTGSSIAYVFLVTSIIFGIFAIIGKTTKADLSKLSIYLFVALISVIILEIVNIFIASNTLNFALCAVTIIIFCAYVAYDVNMLLRNNFLDGTDNEGIYFAFQLFVDFINLFIRLIELFGKRKN